MTGVSDKEYNAMEKFIEHFKRSVVVRDTLPLKLRYKSGNLIINISVDRIEVK